MSISTKSTKRFMSLYDGLHRSYGLFRNGRAKTVRAEVSEGDYDRHLSGEIGLGIVPINEENICHFGVIDIDKDDIDHSRLVEQVNFFKLPLIVCRSKSGGAHLYTFSRKAVPARFLRKIMAKWAADLGYGASEIFPKQNMLGKGDVGNWINLPYFDMANTIRYGVDKDGPMVLAKFLDMAEAMAEAADLEKEFSDRDLEPDGMPPCLSHLYHTGVSEGGRNEALYQFGVFGRKSDHPDVEDFLFQMNFKAIDPPLSAKEVKSVLGSVKKNNYQYKCKHPLFKEHCNSDACKRLKFGVGTDMAKDTDYDEHMIGCLTKFLTNPVRWRVDINGLDVDFNTEELMDYRKVRCLSMERANIIAPPMKQEEWLLVLKSRLEHVKIIEAPEDASQDGDVIQVLSEFIQIAERAQAGGREDIVRGIPIRDKVYEMGDEVPVVMFRSQDLLSYIKRRKINLNFTSNMLWMHLRKIGVGHTKIRIKSIQVQVWYIHTTDDYQSMVLEPMDPVMEI